MSNDYIYGFCKTAYAHGVDPAALLKEAGLSSMVSKYLADGAALAAKRKAAYSALERIRSLAKRIDGVRTTRKNIFDAAKQNNGRLLFPTHDKELLKNTRYDKRMLYKELLNSVKDINNQFGTNILPQDVKNFWPKGIHSDGVTKLLGIAEQADAALRHHNITGATAAAAAAVAGTGGAYALGRGIGALRSAEPNTQVTP